VLCLKTLTPTACVSRANLRHRDSGASVSKRHASHSGGHNQNLLTLPHKLVRRKCHIAYL
jgi:hypothetical protein